MGLANRFLFLPRTTVYREREKLPCPWLLLKVALADYPLVHDLSVLEKMYRLQFVGS